MYSLQVCTCTSLLVNLTCRLLCLSHVFAVFDKDHNGTIDFSEFLLAIAADSPADLDSHLNYVFEMYERVIMLMLSTVRSVQV